jgi:hypothetical protein
MEDTVRLRVQYLLDIHQQLNIHVYNSSEVASDTDETSYGVISGEKHGCTPGCTLVKLYVF